MPNIKRGMMGAAGVDGLVGTVWGWGNNESSSLSPVAGNVSSPIQLGNGIKGVVSVAPSEKSIAILNDTGEIWAWGGGQYGQLGQEDTTDHSFPVQVGSDTDWDKLASNKDGYLATKTGGTLWSWGSGSSGQRGLLTVINYSSPTQVGADTTWQYPDGEDDRNPGCATKSDSTAWGWGRPDNGWIGSGTGVTVYPSSPTQVNGGAIWDRNWTGGTFQLLVKPTGAIWCAGHYYVTGLAANVSTPVQIGTLTDWGTSATAKVATGHTFCLVIKPGGTLWAWGRTDNGQAGVAGRKSSPTQIGSDTDWAYCAASSETCMATKTDGTLWTWGGAEKGLLGDSGASLTNVSSPVQVGTDTDWGPVFAGYQTAAAIKIDEV